MSQRNVQKLEKPAVKRTLRRSIYEKLLRLGPAYSQNVATSEAVQLAAEGGEQLATYFGADLPSPTWHCSSS